MLSNNESVSILVRRKSIQSFLNFIERNASYSRVLFETIYLNYFRKEHLDIEKHKIFGNVFTTTKLKYRRNENYYKWNMKSLFVPLQKSHSVCAH